MVIDLEIRKGDLVTRKSYNHDTVFKVINIKENIFYLKGIDMRIYANSPKDDLRIYKEKVIEENYLAKLDKNLILDRDDFFYLPAKILHIDGDADYLKRCLNFYNSAGVLAIGKKIK